MEFHVPGIFDRLRGIQRIKKQELQTFRDSQSNAYVTVEHKVASSPNVEVVFHEEIVVPKGDVAFNDKCLAASQVCKQMSKRYSWLNVTMQFLTCLCSSCCGLVVLVSFDWGIAMGVMAAFFSIVNSVFGWNSLQEKYAALARNFVRLMRSTDKDAENRFQEYILFMESSVLESDYE